MKVRKFVLFYAHLHGLYGLQHNIDCMMLNYNLKYEIINSLSLWFLSGYILPTVKNLPFLR